MTITYKQIVQYGDTGDYVSAIQEALITLGYDLGNTGKDGIFGSKTKTAVESFQSSRNLSITGIVDSVTWELLGITSFTPITYIEGQTSVFGKGSSIQTYSNTVLSYKAVVGSYITNLANNTTMALPVNPTELSQAIQVSWASTQIPGRSSAFLHYTGTENRSFNFSLKLHLDMSQIVIPDYSLSSSGLYYNQGATTYTDIDIEEFLAFLNSLAYPEYDGTYIRPPLCKLVIEDEINTRVVVQHVNTTKSGPMKTHLNYRTGSSKYLFAIKEVSLSFVEYPEQVLTASGVKHLSTPPVYH